MDREQIELDAPGLDRPGTVIRYGHYGRPVVVFPSEQGRAWDYESNGMVGAVADLIDAGRVKLYCVDSFDHVTWSDRRLPLEERARRHRAYQSWITDQVAAYVGDDSAGAGDAIVTGCSMGAYHALQLGADPRRPVPGGDLPVRQLRPVAPGTRGATAATRRTSPTRPTTCPHLHGDHLDWLRVAAARRADRRARGRGRPHPTGSLPQRPADGRPARREGDLPRARRLGPRLVPRLAVVAQADRPPPAPLLLGPLLDTRAWESPETRGQGAGRARPTTELFAVDAYRTEFDAHRGGGGPRRRPGPARPDRVLPGRRRPAAATSARC